MSACGYGRCCRSRVCKMVLLIALDYVVILSARLLKAGLPAMLCFCFLYNTIPVRLIIWQSTTPIIPKFCRLKSRPKFQKVLTRVDCLISQLAFHADDPVTEKALSATPWRTMKLLYLRALDRSRLSSHRSQCSVNFCEILGAMPWRMSNIKVFELNKRLDTGSQWSRFTFTRGDASGYITGWYRTKNYRRFLPP